MSGPDPKFLRVKQEADAERQRRIAAERSVSMLRLQNRQLRDRIKTLTRDAQGPGIGSSR
jgi:hypothetical protein